ncbi:hypothetical protein [Ktedonosporobacter rubrisoli]|nr:hypothetical protein [Ktedonosporobacter rubrisoli]
MEDTTRAFQFSFLRRLTAAKRGEMLERNSLDRDVASKPQGNGP